MQETFAACDWTSNSPFKMLFDRGYRLILDALTHGQQLCIQPTYARSDRQFGTRSVIYSAAVATTHSGNEQAVHQIKHSWLLRRRGYGFQTGWGVDMLCDIWLAWGFQVNFMYESVH